MALQVAELTGTLTAGQIAPNVTLQDKTVVLSDQEQIIRADDGYDGLGSVTVPAESGGNEALDYMFNTPMYDGEGEYNTPATYEMTAESGNTVCNGFNVGIDVTLPAAITQIADYAFEQQKHLKSITAPGVTVIGTSAFRECEELNSVSMPAAVTIRGGAFFNCYYVRAANFPVATTLGEGAFEGSGLRSTVEFPLVTSVGEACFKGTSISSIRLPACSSLGDLTFQNCNNLRNLWLGYDSVAAVDGTDMFTGVNEDPSEDSVTVTVHVPAAQLASYQADSDWAAIIADAATENTTVTFAGDYE